MGLVPCGISVCEMWAHPEPGSFGTPDTSVCISTHQPVRKWLLALQNSNQTALSWLKA